MKIRIMRPRAHEGVKELQIAVMDDHVRTASLA